MGTTDTYDVKRDVDEALTSLRIALRASSEHLIERSAWKLVAALEKAEKFAAVTEPERTPETVLRAMLAAYNDAENEAVERNVRGEQCACYRGRIQDIREALACHRVKGPDPIKHCVLHVLVCRDYEARLAGSRPLNAPPLEV